MQPDFTKLKPVTSEPNFANLKPIEIAPVVPELGFVDKFKAGIVNVLKDIVGIEQNKSQAFIPSVLRSTIGSQGLAGVAQLPGRVIDAVLHPEDPNNITASQALGTTVNAGLTALTGGGGSLAKNAGLTGVKNVLARGAENAVLGASFQAGSNLSENKNIGENIGTATLVGGILPIAGTVASKAKNAILSKATPVAETLINSLIKPLQKDFAYGKNPAQGILREGIVANDLATLSRKVADRTSQIGQSIGEVGQKIEKSGITLDLTPALTPIDNAIQMAAKSNNQTLFHSLQNVKTALIHELTVGADDKGVPAIIQGNPKNLLTAGYNDAKQFLSDISEHTRFTGNPSDDKALNMATKKAYGIARDIMNNTADKVDKNLGIEIRDLNQRYGDLLSAKNAINHRDIVEKRQNFLSLANKFGVHLSVVGAVMTGLASGDWVKAGQVLVAELATIVAGKTIGGAGGKTRIAQFLSRLAPEERNGILNSTPVLKNYYERITGQTTPSPDAPKTKTLQSVEDYLKNPKLGLSIEEIKITPEIKDTIVKELKNVDTTPLTVNGKPDLSDADMMFRLEELKKKALNYKNLTPEEQKEALGLLSQIGIDATKPAPVKATFKQNPVTGKMEGKTKK